MTIFKKIWNALDWVFFDKLTYSRTRILRIGWMIAAVLVGVLTLILGLMMGGIAIDRHFSQQSCEARAELIGTEEYNWQDFTFFDYGCYRIDERGTTSDNYSRILIEE